jgi:hypothetical protein
MTKINEDQLAIKWRRMKGVLDEKSRRHWAASESMALGSGGTRALHRVTGLAINTIRAGIEELKALELEPETLAKKGDPKRMRKPGGGRKKASVKQPKLLPAIKEIVENSTRGDPMSELKWTTQSLRTIQSELEKQEILVTPPVIAEALREMGYSLQAQQKTREGGDNPDRDEQFKYINSQTADFMARGQPVISVDTKKKELVGNYKNAGQQWLPKGTPIEVNMHDFPNPDMGKGCPYGIYDMARNEGWVNVGINHDTGEFAVESIRRWWNGMGKQHYPNATELLITADGGGSNGSRVRLWKLALQALADELGIKIKVCHFPPGTSKWNKIEHRMFCHITRNWRGKVLESYAVIVNCIANTTTKEGLLIQAVLDENKYEAGKKITKKELAAKVKLEPHSFRAQWNYAILPNK